MLTSSTACKALRHVALAVLLCCAGTSTTSAGAAATGCMAQAGKRHGIDPVLLLAIAKVESSFRPGQVNRNRDGSWDVGLMQINSSNFATLEKRGIDRRKLKEPCASIEAGAIVLSQFIARHGYTWTAVGAYNAGSSPKRQAARKVYAKKVWLAYHELHKNPEKRQRLLALWKEKK